MSMEDAALPEPDEDAPLVRDIEAEDEAGWRTLWDGYCRFYGVGVPGHVTDALWQRLFDPDSPIYAIVVEDDEGEVRGFAHYVLHPYTWGTEQLCYLEDLYVAPEARGQGLGRAMIEFLHDRAREEGWARLYWMTRADSPARRLYDRFIPADDHVRYLLAMGGVAPPKAKEEGRG